MVELKRKITVRHHPKFKDLLASISSKRDTQDAVKNSLTAVGYLATWAMGPGGSDDRYGEVAIYGDEDGNLSAVYRNGNGTVTYEIFGLLDPLGTYSFHS